MVVLRCFHLFHLSEEAIYLFPVVLARAEWRTHAARQWLSLLLNTHTPTQSVPNDGPPKQTSRSRQMDRGLLRPVSCCGERAAQPVRQVFARYGNDHQACHQ